MARWFKPKPKVVDDTARVPVKPVEVEEPTLVAEQLLIKVLPAPLYLSMSAKGYCDIPGVINKSYRLRRNGKTEVTNSKEEVFSSCIVLSTDAPDTDRIIAEYLLIVDDEKEYLKIANLTMIRGMSRQTAWQPRHDYGIPNYNYVMVSTSCTTVFNW